MVQKSLILSQLMVHKLLYAAFLLHRGIVSLIRNSPGLLNSEYCFLICNYTDMDGMKLQRTIDSYKNKFSDRKLSHLKHVKMMNSKQRSTPISFFHDPRSNFPISTTSLRLPDLLVYLSNIRTLPSLICCHIGKLP